MKIAALLAMVLTFLVAAPAVFASGSSGGDAAAHEGSEALLWVAVIILAASISRLVEKIGQPAVLGELLVGVALGGVALLGLHFFEPIKENSIIKFLAEFGVVILLFQVGLESDISEMRKNGARALLVALIGIILPMMLGIFVAPMLLDLTFEEKLFLGATLTATSVGITARVLRDLGKSKTKEGQIIIGAAVFDDILGLIILAVVSAIAAGAGESAQGASKGIADIGIIFAKAAVFLLVALVGGMLFAPYLGRLFAKIHTGTGMKFSLVIIIGLAFAYLANQVDLAFIVGAFVAGLILKPAYFRFFQEPELVEKIKNALQHASEDVKQGILGIIHEYSERHVHHLIEPLAFLLVPIFFVVTGMQVNLETLGDPRILAIGAVITLIAFLGKIVAGLAMIQVKETKKSIKSMLIVGIGMVPRGEVALIFATIGKGMGVISDELFSVIIIMTILTTFPVPPVLAWLLKK